jgi:glycosyltransferase involved in cell wall biosynthesis
MPAFNEETTIEAIIRKVMKYNHVHQLIVVNDASTDSTPEILKSLAEEYPCIEVIHHLNNLGKTAALKVGFTSISGDVVVIQDADLEYDPEDIPSLIEPIVKGLADVVYGSRFRIRKTGRVIYFYHYLANMILTFFSNLFTNLNMTDVETCYKAFKSPILQNMIITSKGFGIEIEMTAKISKLPQIRVFEVPISYYGRSYEEGKKIHLSDGVWAVWYIIKYNCFCSIKKSFSLPHQKILKSFPIVH